MSGALQTANQELIRQLLLGQHAIETSLRRLRDNESKTLTWADEKENSHVFSTKSEENTAVSSSKETSKKFSLNTELLEADGNQRRSRSKRNAEEDAEEEDYRGIRSILARSNVQRRSVSARLWVLKKIVGREVQLIQVKLNHLDKWGAECVVSDTT